VERKGVEPSTSALRNRFCQSCISAFPPWFHRILRVEGEHCKALQPIANCAEQLRYSARRPERKTVDTGGRFGALEAKGRDPDAPGEYRATAAHSRAVGVGTRLAAAWPLWKARSA
jgi:hypothetical protein